MKTLLLIILNLIIIQVSAQTTSYKFRIRYADYSALASARFLINGQQLTTDPQGIISLSIPNQISFANIGSSNTKLYQIDYPMEGRATLPKDNSITVDIFVSKPGPDMLKIAVQQMTRIAASNDALLIRKLQEESRRGYDSIVILLSKNTRIDERALLRGRMEFLPLITSALNQYLNEAKDANGAFLAIKNSMNNAGAFKQFGDAILSYNGIYELLNGNKSTYEQAINTYWKSKELSLKFSSLIEFAIEDIHRPYLLEINYTFLDRIYQYNQEPNKTRKRELEKALQNDISAHSASLARRLNTLAERVAIFNTLLNNHAIAEN